MHARYLALQTSYQAIAVQEANRAAGARPAPAGAGPLPPRRRHLARGLRRAERGAAGRGRLRERGVRLPQGRRRAGSGGRATPSLTRNAHVAWDEGRSDHRGAGAGWRRRDRLQHEQEEERRHRGPDGAGRAGATWSAPSPRAGRSSRRPRWTSPPTSPAASSGSRWRRATWSRKGQFLIQIDPAQYQARGLPGARRVRRLHPGHAAPGPRQPRPGRARAGSGRTSSAALGPNLIAPEHGRAGADGARRGRGDLSGDPGAAGPVPGQPAGGARTTWRRPGSSRPIAGPGGAARGRGGRGRGAGHVLAGDRPPADHRRPVGDPGQGAGGRDRRGAPRAAATRSR